MRGRARRTGVGAGHGGRVTACSLPSLPAMTAPPGGRRFSRSCARLASSPPWSRLATSKGAGANIVVTLPGSGPKTILVGAHYDRVNVGRGAVDNGGACATLVELVAAVKASPLGRGRRCRWCSSTARRPGSLGSRAYFAAAGRRAGLRLEPRHLRVRRCDFATASHPDGVLLPSLRAAGEALGLPVRDVPRTSYPGSDHLSMMERASRRSASRWSTWPTSTACWASASRSRSRAAGRGS